MRTAEAFPVGGEGLLTAALFPLSEADTGRRILPYRDVLAAQRAALISERDAGNIDDEAVRAMLGRLDLQEASVTARMESRL